MAEITVPLLLTLSDSLSTQFNIQFGAAETQWAGFCSDVTSVGLSQGYPRLDEIPGLREWIGSRSVHDLSASAFEITNKQFEGTIRIKRTDIKFDRYGIYTPAAQMLGGRASELPDLLAFGLLASGESLKAYDGAAFFGSHAGYDRLGNASTFVNLQQPTGGDTAGPAWYLMDTRQPLKPLIKQTAEPFNLRAMMDLESYQVFMTDEFVWGVDGMMNVGLGYFQTILKSYAPLTPTYYAAARSILMGQHRVDGTPYGIRPNKLYHPTSLTAAARSLLKIGVVGATLNPNPWVDTAEPIESQWLS
jgi:phage major head subunit gpT-like protein